MFRQFFAFPGIPYSTYAKYVVDTVTILGQGGDKGFSNSQAQTHIAHVLEFHSGSRCSESMLATSPPLPL